MKKRLLIVLTFITCFLLPAVAQVSVEASIDSLELLIGEQAHITLQVSLDSDKRLQLPVYPDTLVRGVEVLDVAKPDTQYINDNKRMLIKEVYTITSFDSALYYLPPMEVKVEDDIYKSNPLALKVMTMPVDTLHPEQFFGPKDVMKPNFMWSDWYGIIACVVLWIPAVFLLLYFIKRFRDNQPIIRKVKVEPKLPPHMEAMQEIDRIRNEKVWQHGLQKEYYTQLTDTLRTYIERRFGFKALEMTTDQIIDRLESIYKRFGYGFEESVSVTLEGKEGIEKIGKKVGEEAIEAIISASRGDKENTVLELADLFYHALVMMAQMGITPEEVEDELKKR